jgi:hypothetical protein
MRAVADAHKAAGTFFFSEPENAEFILFYNARVAHSGAFAALVADPDMERTIRLFVHTKAREVPVFRFVICR